MGPLLFILYTSETFELVETRLYANADDSTLLADFRKPVDRPAVAASISFWPCGLGIRIHPTFALVRVVRVD